MIISTNDSKLRNFLGKIISEISRLNGFRNIGGVSYILDDKLKVSLRSNIIKHKLDEKNDKNNQHIDIDKDSFNNLNTNSLKKLDNNELNNDLILIEIAQYFGGGGHKTAASFNICKNELNKYLNSFILNINEEKLTNIINGIF